VSVFTRRSADLMVAVVLLAVAVAAAAMDGQSRVLPPPDARVRLAWEAVNRRAVESRQAPLWNPGYFGGQPLIGNSEAAVAYPPAIVLRLLPADWFMLLTFVLHAWALGLGVYLVMRRTRTQRSGACLTALATMAAGAFAVPAFSASTALQTFAWLPLVAMCAFHGSERNTRIPPVLLVLLLATIILGGAVRGDWWAALTVIGCYALAMIWPTRVTAPRRTLAIQGATAIGLALGITAFQAIPAWALTSALHTGELAYRQDENAPLTQSPDVRRLLERLGPHRTISACPAVTSADLVNAGVPTADGLAWYSAGYGRFRSLAAGAYPARYGRRDDNDVGRAREVRQDLLAWLGVRYLIDCTAPDLTRWRQVDQAGPIVAYESTTTPLSATWTCTPRAVSAGELEYELATRVYDQRLTLAGRWVMIHVRWAPQVDEPARARAETELQLNPVQFIGERTWRYALADTKMDHVRSIVTHPLVEDIAHISRNLEATGLPRPAISGPKSEWLVGDDACPAAGQVQVVRTKPFMGRLILQVVAPQPGVVVLPEPYFPGRRARVDGEGVTPLRVNFAFLAVPVGAGSHRIDVLSYSPGSLWLGGAVSLLTLVGWTVASRRSPSSPRHTRMVLAERAVDHARRES